jgi:hypothetical protein
MTTDHPVRMDIAAALRDPAGHFKDPQAVLRASGIDREDKLRLLEEWERDARALAVAEEEGLSEGEPSMLARVREARLSLTGGAPAKTGSTTKHG